MMKSPIPDAFWHRFFATAAFTVGSATLVSLWNQRRLTRSKIDEPLAVLAKCKKGENAVEVDGALAEISRVLDEEQRGGGGATTLVVQDSFSTLLKHISYDDDNRDTARIVSQVLKIVQKVAGSADDDDAKRALYKAGGYKKMLAVLAAAHSQGHQPLMEESAAVLEQLTHVADEEIVLASDVPSAAVGTYALINYPATVKMLRCLDWKAPAMFLVHVSGVFANVCALADGAKSVAVGVDGESGASYFLKLLALRGNQRLLENAMRALQGIACYWVPARKELAKKENVQKLVELMDPIQTTRSIEAMLAYTIIMVADKEIGQDFAKELVACNGAYALIRLWTKSGEKEVRENAEEVVQVLKMQPSVSAEVRKALEDQRGYIMERKAKDEEGRRREMQQQQHNRMMQMQMMMQQMGGEGGMPPGMM